MAGYGSASIPTDSHSESSMSEILLAPLNELQSLAQALFASLSATQTKPPPAPPLSAFLNVDVALASAVKQARAHQVQQRKIERLKTEFLALETQWRDIVMELEQGKRDLSTIVEEGKERVKAIEDAKAASLPYPELLAYAQSISSFTAAPPNMPDISLPGQPPPPLFFPPFPNEEKMRRGRMNAAEPLKYLGETHPVAKPRTASPPKSVENHLPGANPYRFDPRAHQPSQIFDLDLDLNPDL